jgi:hypothetical protein
MQSRHPRHPGALAAPLGCIASIRMKSSPVSIFVFLPLNSGADLDTDQTGKRPKAIISAAETA